MEWFQNRACAPPMNQLFSANPATLKLYVELRANATAEEGLAPRLQKLVVASLLRTNSEYRQLHQTFGQRAEPTISLHRFGTDGFAHGIKHRWTGEPG